MAEKSKILLSLGAALASLTGLSVQGAEARLAVANDDTSSSALAFLESPAAEEDELVDSVVVVLPTPRSRWLLGMVQLSKVSTAVTWLAVRAIQIVLKPR